MFVPGMIMNEKTVLCVQNASVCNSLSAILRHSSSFKCNCEKTAVVGLHTRHIEFKG